MTARLFCRQQGCSVETLLCESKPAPIAPLLFVPIPGLRTYVSTTVLIGTLNKFASAYDEYRAR